MLKNSILRPSYFSRALARAPMAFYAPPGDIPPGSPTPPAPGNTLEEQLANARSALVAAESRATTAENSLSAMTTERDTARTELGNLQSQFDTATTTANQLRTDLTAAQNRVTELTTENTGLKTKLESANTNTKRLETLCGVLGVDHSQAVPVVEGQPGVKSTVADFSTRISSAKSNSDVYSALEEFGTAAKEGKIARA